MQARSRLSPTALGLSIAATMAALILSAAPPAGASLLAPGSKCPGQQNVHAPEREQEDALRCLIEFARQHGGAGHVSRNRSLERAAGRKAGDVMRCGFSHTACGKPADLYAQKYGYMSSGSWSWGENLGWGRGKRGSARGTLDDWLHSPPHRETLLHGSFEHLGIGLKRGGFEGHRHSAVWVLELGCHGC